ncbi:MAG: M23 family metallopeptidase [Chitinophagales bacterium]|nr:M23 family metallopeptidase [Chitinophagales bacterium]
MSKKKLRFDEWWEKVKSRYRFQVVDEEDHHVKLVFILSRLNVFALISTIFVILFIFMFCLIAYTPIKQYLPGFGKAGERREMIKLKVKAEELAEEMEKQDKYIANLLNISKGGNGLSGKKRKPIQANEVDTNTLEKNSKSILKLRSDVENRQQYALQESNANQQKQGLESVYFFPPVKGLISLGYKPKEGRYGIDVITEKDMPIKSVLDGTVIFTGFTLNAGYTISIQHENHLISFYKMAAQCFKKEGDPVKAGEVIGVVGSSPTLSNAPTLHFEIWYKGKASNPTEYINFE